MRPIAPCLWFDKQTEDAMTLYTSAFPNSRIVHISRYPDQAVDEGMQGFEGKVHFANFELAGQPYMALDGGPMFQLTPAISLFVHCADEAEVDSLWAALAEGGQVLMPLDAYPFSPKFGWCNDRNGVSWQLSLNPQPPAQKIAPYFLFVGEQAGKAEAAMALYTALFPNAGIDHIARYETSGAGGAAGTVQLGVFTLNGQTFMAADSDLDHAFTFTPALSLYVEVDTQDEVDRLWNALSADPAAEQCGWLKDQFGVSWQIIPEALPRLMNDPDREKGHRVMMAMLQMKKIDVAELERAYAG